MQPAFQAVMDRRHPQETKKKSQQDPIPRDEPSKFVQRGANQNPDQHESHAAPAQCQTDAPAFPKKPRSSFAAAGNHAVTFVSFLIHDADD